MRLVAETVAEVGKALGMMWGLGGCAGRRDGEHLGYGFGDGVAMRGWVAARAAEMGNISATVLGMVHCDGRFGGYTGRRGWKTSATVARRDIGDV